ncbi:hypothetical protein BRC20_00775 [Candidatus Saccharibacteria bacterium QS_8_54_8]|nr:MAG: hypothetical protein BRC20_00775 [Candidatus Saccharibacteria bacterium QS_8_54_8]
MAIRALSASVTTSSKPARRWASSWLRRVCRVASWAFFRPLWAFLAPELWLLLLLLLLLLLICFYSFL